jgi:hypothetical protein
MKSFRVCLLFILAASVFAQLTPDQREADFRFLAAIYAKNYGPYEWKRDTQNFDLLNAEPFLTRARTAKNDLDFYEVMVEYVASLNDAHDSYTLPSNFVARLNFGVDIYDGKVLVDTINRTRLPVTEFPFRIGYELVSIDGVAATDLIRQFAKYSIAANTRSTRRVAASYLTSRFQVIMPHAVEVGDVAKVVFRRPNGETENHTIPWTKTGLPLTNIGPIPTPEGSASTPKRAAFRQRSDWQTVLRRLQKVSLDRPRSIIGWGARAPVFAPPAGFQQRLGRATADVFYSGTFNAGGYRIGFLRIPDYAPANIDAAIDQYINEIAYMEANTDGLIIDDMRNPGGYVDLGNIYLQLVMPTNFRVIGFELRATSEWILEISSALESARAQGAPAWVLALFGQIKKEIEDANASNRGRTGPLPLDDITIDREPLLDSRGRVFAYTKPMMVLVDELSASGGDAFPAMFQDNKRGIVFGYRTMGAGGNVVGYDAGPYSEGTTSVTQSLMNRGRDIVTSDFPAAPYVENIGVRPDIEADYMTVDNLMQNGRPFVDSFVAAMIEHIRRSRQ